MIARVRQSVWTAAPATLLLVLAACSSSDAPPPTAGDAIAQETLRGGGRYKIGKPYQIKGVWYYPRIDYAYSEVGVASWYGPGFHGKMTANGEIYDMNDLTAAHRTLPMPSIVDVTNLDNGRRLRLRINDRGPFVGDRIIDLSRRAAQLLGVYGPGTGLVRVDIVADESMQIAEAMTGTAYPTLAETVSPRTVSVVGASAVPAATLGASRADVVAPLPPAAAQPTLAAIGETTELPSPPPPAPAIADLPVEVAALAPPDAAVPAEEAAAAPPPPRIAAVPGNGAAKPEAGTRFVQAGAFADPHNVQTARARLTGLGPVEVQPVAVDGRTIMRVRVGPLPSPEAAQRVLAQAVQAGFTASRVIVE